jgi:predicted negative regulator of RcsB-dependent stress response
MKSQFNLRLIIVLIMTLSVVCSYAQGITTPRTPSPAAKVSQTIGISTVTISYSRPSVKSREIWGPQVLFGWNKQGFGAGNDAPWRAGANENTVIEFSHAAKVGGQPVPAGKYGLFFVINKDDSGEVILSKDYRSWGSFWYDSNHDQLRAKIQVRTIPHTELLTYDFINLTKNSGELVLNWEKKQFPVAIEFAVDELVLVNATEELKGPVGFNAQGYSSAANYALQNKINMPQALLWIDQAIAQNNNFGNANIKSGILKEMGKTDEAEKIVKDAIGGSTEAELNAYGYQLLNQGQTDKAIEILTLNTQRFAKSANAWDSLGEACVTKGDKANAIKHFKKSLSLNPPAATKANSEKFLKQLGAN